MVLILAPTEDRSVKTDLLEIAAVRRSGRWIPRRSQDPPPLEAVSRPFSTPRRLGHDPRVLPCLIPLSKPSSHQRQQCGWVHRFYCSEQATAELIRVP